VGRDFERSGCAAGCATPARTPARVDGTQRSSLRAVHSDDERIHGCSPRETGLSAGVEYERPIPARPRWRPRRLADRPDYAHAQGPQTPCAPTARLAPLRRVVRATSARAAARPILALYLADSAASEADDRAGMNRDRQAHSRGHVDDEGRGRQAAGGIAHHGTTRREGPAGRRRRGDGHASREADRPSDPRCLLVGFARRFRRSELVGSTSATSSPRRPGRELRRSKTDQEAPVDVASLGSNPRPAGARLQAGVRSRIAGGLTGVDRHAAPAGRLSDPPCAGSSSGRGPGLDPAKYAATPCGRLATSPAATCRAVSRCNRAPVNTMRPLHPARSLFTENPPPSGCRRYSAPLARSREQAQHEGAVAESRALGSRRARRYARRPGDGQAILGPAVVPPARDPAPASGVLGRAHGCCSGRGFGRRGLVLGRRSHSWFSCIVRFPRLRGLPAGHGSPDGGFRVSSSTISESASRRRPVMRTWPG